MSDDPPPFPESDCGDAGIIRGDGVAGYALPAPTERQKRLAALKARYVTDGDVISLMVRDEDDGA